VRARIEEMERLQGGPGSMGPAFWDRRAPRFVKGPMASTDGDPLMPRLRRAVRPGSVLLDVGSGPGRFSLALAPRAGEVVAVDPSRRMLQILRRRAREAGVTNVRTVVGRWEEVGPAAADIGADVALCAHVLPLIADPAPFLRKLDAAARRRVIVYLGAFAADAIADPFWRYFHGAPRRTAPSYLDAMAVMEEVGIRPEVEVVEVPVRARYATIEEAVDSYRESLALPNTAAVRRELAGLLGPWLQRRDGVLRPPLRTQPAAIISWAPARTE
jgi:SAM-dependent methyltransferase